MKEGQQKAFTVPVLVDYIPRGDGSWIAKPRFCKFVGDDMIPAKDAMKLLHIKDWETFWGLLDQGLIVGVRPTERICLVSLESVLKHLDATSDPSFWQRRSLLR